MASNTGIYTPFFALNLQRDNTRSTEGEDFTPRPLFIGQKLATGTAANGAILKVNTLADVEALAGKGSHLYTMMTGFFAERPKTESYIGVLADAGGATKASRDFTISTVATESGTLSYRINGERFSTAVLDTDSVTDIADKIVTAIGADAAVSGRNFTAANVAGVVTITSANGGIAVGQIEISVLKDSTDREIPGLTYVVGAITAGTGDPDVQDVFDSIGDAHYYLMLSPYADATNLGKAEVVLDELGNEYNARDAEYITATTDTTSNLTTLAASIANKYVSILDIEGWQTDKATILGHIGREISNSVLTDVNRPLHNMAIPQIVAPVTGTERVWEDRNALARDGIAGLNPDNITLETPCTTFIATSEERRWENIFNLTSLRISFKNRIIRDYGRAKLKRGEERVAPGQIVINEAIAKAAGSQWYGEKVFVAQVEDKAYFDANISVDITDVDTLTWFLPITLVGQYVVGDGSMNYILGSN